MPDCIDCSVHAHHAAATASPWLDAAAQQPLGTFVVVLLALYALLTMARHVADRVEPQRRDWRPAPIPVTVTPRVWRFRDTARRNG